MDQMNTFELLLHFTKLLSVNISILYHLCDAQCNKVLPYHQENMVKHLWLKSVACTKDNV